MAFSYKTAALCLVALCGLQQPAAADTTTYKFTVLNVDDDAYLSVMLARNGKMPVHISDLTTSEDIVSQLTTQLQDTGAIASGTCDAMQIKDDLKKMFHVPFDYDSTSVDYRELLQGALDKGLNIFQKKYPQSDAEWQNIWKQEDGANLSYLLAANSTQIGCAIGRCTTVNTPADPQPPEQQPTESPTNHAMLFCQLTPAATENQAPFNEDYFSALITRKAQLNDMTEEDLKVPSNGTSTAAALPTILIAGLAAMLATVSL
ncbi:SAG family member [Eimeria praecox]|uniref:SAG family member n=1 Tax=Eimeria praecox TaxID=51316 RepID=U6G6A9_9EIME|nr:SAG family member [Eimeria praecox]